MSGRSTSAAIVLIYLILALAGCGSPNEDQTGGFSIQTSNPASKGGPAPNYLLMSITPQQQEYKQDDRVNFTVTIKNVWKESLQIINNPNILVGPATVSTDEYDLIAVPDLAKQTIKPGDTVTTYAAWMQRGEPGMYQVQFGDIDLGNTKLSGGGSRFFISFPSDKVQTKTIQTTEEIKLPTENGNLTFKLKSIEMNEHETKVYFEFVTDLDAPMGFQISLATSKGDNHSLEVEQSQPRKGIIAGVAKFNPTNNEVTKLQIRISDWTVVYTGVRSEILKGPWTIDIPIK